MVNRTQALVVGFFLVAVTTLLVILAAAPEVDDQALRLPTGNHPLEIAARSTLGVEPTPAGDSGATVIGKSEQLADSAASLLRAEAVHDGVRPPGS